MGWAVDLLVPDGWSLHQAGLLYRIEARPADGSQEHAPAAVGALELASDSDLDTVRAALEDGSSPFGEVLMRREVVRAQIGGRDVLTVLDITHEAGPDGKQAGHQVTQSFCGYLRDRPSGLLIRLEMSTLNLLAFEDIVTTCTDFLASARLARDEAS